MLLDLNDFLHHVVEDEEHEDTLAGHDEVVHHRHVADQFHRTEVKGRDDAASRRELQY